MTERTYSDKRDPTADLVMAVVIIALIALACALLIYTFYGHPAVEWLSPSEDLPGSLVIGRSYARTIACNHALMVCVGLPW